MKTLIEKWFKIVRKIINIQSNVLLFIVYYLIIVPVSVCLKIFGSKRLMGYSYFPKENSNWSIKIKQKHDLIWARSQ